jgi:hypothetical protein
MSVNWKYRLENLDGDLLVGSTTRKAMNRYLKREGFASTGIGTFKRMGDRNHYLIVKGTEIVV